MTARAIGVRAVAVATCSRRAVPTVTALKLTQHGRARGSLRVSVRRRRVAQRRRRQYTPVAARVRGRDHSPARGWRSPRGRRSGGAASGRRRWVRRSSVAVARFGGGRRRRPTAPRVTRPVDNFGPDTVFADAHDDDLDGARMEDDARRTLSCAETRRACAHPRAEHAASSRPTHRPSTEPRRWSRRAWRRKIFSTTYPVLAYALARAIRRAQTRRVRHAPRTAHTRLRRGVVRDGVRVHLRAGRGVTRAYARGELLPEGLCSDELDARTPRGRGTSEVSSSPSPPPPRFSIRRG